jgi:hypothetical protein
LKNLSDFLRVKCQRWYSGEEGIKQGGSKLGEIARKNKTKMSGNVLLIFLMKIVLFGEQISKAESK